MKILCPFLAGFSMAFSMNATTYDEIATWITLFALSMLGTMVFTYLEDKL